MYTHLWTLIELARVWLSPPPSDEAPRLVDALLLLVVIRSMVHRQPITYISAFCRCRHTGHIGCVTSERFLSKESILKGDGIFTAYPFGSIWQHTTARLSPTLATCSIFPALGSFLNNKDTAVAPWKRTETFDRSIVWNNSWNHSSGSVKSKLSLPLLLDSTTLTLHPSPGML
jgi:hypothetical protein